MGFELGFEKKTNFLGNGIRDPPSRPSVCLSVRGLSRGKVALQASPTFIVPLAQRESCSGDPNDVCLRQLFINPFSEIGIFSAFFMN